MKYYENKEIRRVLDYYLLSYKHNSYYTYNN